MDYANFSPGLLHKTRPAPAISINQLNLRKKRKGMDAPVQPQPQIMFAIFSVGKKRLRIA
jgi:hypothetical protein